MIAPQKMKKWAG